MKAIGIHIVVFFAGIISCFAQSLDALNQESESLYTKVKPTLPNVSQEFTSEEIPFQYQVPISKNKNQLQIDAKEIESQYFKKDIGLVFKANGNYNFRDALDEETNSYIVGSARMELEWNILKQGFTQNKFKAQQLQNEIDILKLEKENSQKEIWRRQFRIDFNYILNQEAIALSRNFLSFENEYFDFLNKLYFKKHIRRDKLIATSNQIAVLKSQLEILEKENSVLKDSVSEQFQNTKTLPLFRINLEHLKLADQTALYNLEAKNIDLRHKSVTNYSFSLYANQNYFYRTTSHTFFPAVGFRFRAPIRFGFRKKMVQAQKKILKAEQADKHLGKMNITVTYIKEYNERLRDLQNQYKAWELLEEKIRVATILKAEINGAESGLLLLNYLEEQFKISQNLLQLKRQVYKVSLQLFQLDVENNVKLFFTPYTFEKTTFAKIASLQKSKQFSTAFQIEFLKAKQIQKVLVLKKDKCIQRALKKEEIAFTIVDTVLETTIEEMIAKELNNLK